MIISSSLRGRLEALIRRRPFLRLVRHFCTRALSTDSTSDFDFGLGGVLAFLALPGAFTSILLLDKYSTLLQWMRGQRQFNPYLVSLQDEYFFIVFSMAVTGLITLLRWDQLLPDARDFANLASLSLSLRKIFIANVVALGTLAALFAVDINLISAVVFPVLVTLQADSFAALCQFFYAHVLTVMGISLFTFLGLIALQGVLMAGMPDRLYRRVFLLIRILLITLFSGTIISVFLVPNPLFQVGHASASGLGWWPPLWFLSFFESHLGQLQKRSPLGAGPALRALGSAAFLAIVGFSLSYKRHFLKIPERQSGVPRRSERPWIPVHLGFSVFDPLLRPGLETASFRLTSRTLFRSETHLLLVGLSASLGLLLTLQGLRMSSPNTGQTFAQALLIAPITFTLCTLGGLRFVFDIPSHARANWPLRLLAAEGASITRNACRKLMLIIGCLPLLLVWFPIALLKAGWGPAFHYLLFHLLVTALAIELLLWKFKKVPFTCLFTPSRDRLLKVLVGSLVVLLLVVPTLGRIEALVVHRTFALVVLLPLMLGASGWLFRNGYSESEVLLYEDRGAESFALLRLGGD